MSETGAYSKLGQVATDPNLPHGNALELRTVSPEFLCRYPHEEDGTSPDRQHGHFILPEQTGGNRITVPFQ